MMTPETANLAIRFMERAQLTGQEVPAFNKVMQELYDAAKPSAEDSPNELS